LRFANEEVIKAKEVKSLRNILAKKNFNIPLQIAMDG
jgi:hypothetical protein